MLPFMFSSLLNITNAISGGIDRSYLDPPEATDMSIVDRSSADLSWMLGNPTGPCILEEQTALSVPEEGENCSAYSIGSLAINKQNWFDDSLEWLLVCDNNIWSKVEGRFTRTEWEMIDQDIKWVQVDMTFRNMTEITADNSNSGLAGNIMGLDLQDMNCENPEMSDFGGRNNFMMICLGAMTNSESIVAAKCKKADKNDDDDIPDCGGNAQINEESMTYFGTNPEAIRDCLQ